jgi:hypothetical protein
MHGKLGHVPNNLVLIRSSERAGRLAHRLSDGSLQPLKLANFLSGTASVCEVEGVPFSIFRISQLADGRVGLEMSGLFLCAQSNSAATLSRSELRDWERFAAVTQDDIALLQHLCTERWFSTTHQRLLGRGEIAIGEAFCCTVGSIRVTLEQLLGAQVEARDRRSIAFNFDGWKLETLALFRPLIYFAAFGSAEIFECLSLAIQSLLDFGEYDGTIAVLTNRPQQELRTFLPECVRSQVLVFHIPAAGLLDVTFARYRITEWPGAAAFEPILYMDVDIICNAPLAETLLGILSAESLCLCRELQLHHPLDYYGSSLFKMDTTAEPRDPVGLTSGIIGLPNVETVKYTFPLIVRTGYAHARVAGNRQPLRSMDQPIANYVVHKMGGCNTDVLSNRVLNLLGNFNGEMARAGFVHFCGGIGHAVRKLEAMKKYFATICACRNDRVPPIDLESSKGMDKSQSPG